MLRITKKLFQILNTRQKQFVIVLVFMMLLGGIMESLSVSLILPLITAVMDTKTWNGKWYAQLLCSIFNISDQRQYVSVLLILLIIVFVLKNVYLIVEYRIQYNFIGKCRYDMQAGLIHSYIRKPYTFYLSANFGEIIRIINSDVTEAFNLLTGVLLFYTEIIVSIVLGITIIVMSPMMAFGIIIILLVELLVIAVIIKPVMQRTGEGQRNESALSNKWLLQSLNGIKSIKVANKEDYFEDNFKEHARKSVRLAAKYQTLYNLPRLLIEAFTVAGVLFIMLILVLNGMDLASLVPQLSAFVIAAIRLLPSVNRISTSINQVPFYEGGLDNIIRVIKDEDVLESSSSEIEFAGWKNQTFRNFTFNENIAFKDVSFSYPQNDKRILDYTRFKIHAGESVGIIGSSGSGKTTTVDIMLGLLSPSSGSVSVDGDDINDNLPAWLSHLAYIPQSIFLMDDTIRANVAFGIDRSKMSDEKVWESLREAQLEDFVRGLPEGIDTTIGEQGVRLSGGQRQRIGIARALYNDPEILFFDEATSALDNETEKAIMESIENLKGRKTLVIIAHRLTTIENCDVVYKVENGKIIKER